MINRPPTPILSYSTPCNKLFHQEPDYASLKTFGCACYPHLRPYNTNKLQCRSSKCIFIGYSQQHKGYKCLDSSGRVCIARNIVFDEKEFPYSSDPSFSGHSKSQIIHTPYYYMQPLTVPCASSDFISSTHVEPNLSSQEQAPRPSPVNDYVEIIP